MGKQSGRAFYNNRFVTKENPFPQPFASAKHAYHQVNGQTSQAQNTQILEVMTRKRS
ncbi:YpzG family protein [Sutcliffiella halmapala]|uniref:YpzG family protein n=1 Tax=Sutcliffiella halmapala TaxID=79882 RepID=UPI0009951BAB|nr:YpzG family protein [Sutcliffiella halmapala]